MLTIDKGYEGKAMKVDQISKRETAWKLEQAIAQLRANPDDPYLQYLALVLAQRDDKVSEILSLLPTSRIRNRAADLLSVFGGSAAVQECLQLDAMLPDAVGAAFAAQANMAVSTENTSQSHVASISQLKGPAVSSHPWADMLQGRRPEVSSLSKLVPADFFLIESRSVSKLLDSLAAASSWQNHVLHQVQAQGLEFKVVERVQRQLLLDGDQFELLKHSDLNEICLTGSDLYVNDGADITLLASGPQSTVDELLLGLSPQATIAFNEGLICDSFDFGGIRCVSVQNGDRSISTFAANPFAGLHLRSNSRAALERILSAIGNDIEPRLGNTDEFAFVRLMMPWSKQEEDLFVYFSDPFIRNLVGPKVRITERRRKICRGYMQMIDSAVLLYCAQEGAPPASVEALRAARCLTVDHSEMQCPDGGTYAFSEHQLIPQSKCSLHGNTHFMKPCIEIEIDAISPKESNEYTIFVDSYNQYWRTYFDPIGISVRLDDGEYRAQTVVLPLIDNSIYTGLALAVGGTPERLDLAAVHENSIFGLAAKLNHQVVVPAADSARPFLSQAVGDEGSQAFMRMLTEGLGEQFGFNVCDAQPTFSLDLPLLMGMAAAAGTGNNASFNGAPFWLAGLVASLQMPVYVSMNVRNSEIVDQFLEIQFPAMLLNLRTHINRMVDYEMIGSDSGRKTSAITFSLGPVKFRLFLERIENSLYGATQLQILDQLWHQLAGTSPALQAPETTDNANDRASSIAHAALTLTPAKWNKMRHEAALSWLENSRQACHNNLGYLTAYARALLSVEGAAVSERFCGTLHDVLRNSAERRACPEHAVYTFNTATQLVECSVHGCLFASRLVNHDAESQDGLIPIFQIESVVGSLTFIEEGLKAQLVLRKRASAT